MHYASIELLNSRCT